MTPSRVGIGFSRALAGLVTLAAIVAILGPVSATAGVEVVTNEDGSRLQVDGKDFMVLGMNWGYIPIGENYMFNLWNQPDEVIEAALEKEMGLLRAMGVNTIRVYVGIPAKWITYIYEEYGIYTVLNHSMARYGFTLDGTWIPTVDYSDPKLREAVTTEIVGIVEEFKDTPGLLMWLLGNENNYGLSWSSFEIEALPEGERNAARARHLYSLYNDITLEIKQRDDLPVAIANGDIQYIDLIAEECTDIDILGTNVYRGISVRDLYDVVQAKLGIPVMYTEFGADAWNAKYMREDQLTQAKYLIGQWQEIYEQSAGKGRVGNAIGGMIFQWSDGWWKFGQDSRLEVHDTNASWPNSGYPEDYVEGENNMNEEWWGICAKTPPNSLGLYDVYPRAAYYALRDAFRLDPYAPGTDLIAIREHFGSVDPVTATLQARGDKASLEASPTNRVRVSSVRMHLETYSTGGDNITTPPPENPQESLPAFRGFDYLQSFWTDFEVNPAQNVTGSLSLSILGHVPVNPIDEIFYENRGRLQTVVDDNGDLVRLEGLERVKVYNAAVSWDDKYFNLEGYYRQGHTHWGYEGDFFGIYRDAYYGPNLDIYNGNAPAGAVLSGKKQFDGFKVAFGPELHWGANPAVLLKYRREFSGITATAMYQDEFAKQTELTTTVAIPVPPTRRAALGIETKVGQFDLQAGGLWAGSTKVGDSFDLAEEQSDGSYRLFTDKVRDSDTFGGKIKLMLQSGRWNWYGQAALQGIVTDHGPNPMTTYTGWTLKDSGLGNGTNALTGIAVNMGNFQLGPNFLWQKPVVGPVPFEAGRPRNVQTDPFAVRANRETVAGEIILSHDPTPATWMWAWDNIVREDADLAWAVSFIYRHQPTTMDATLVILEDGSVVAADGASLPAEDLWETRLRLVSRTGSRTRIVANAFAGIGQPKAIDPRVINRYGVDGRIVTGRIAVEAFAKFGDWGPYDYHRNFNLTFPVQLMGDVSHSLGLPSWFGFPDTRFGVRGTYRTLDAYSPRYDCPSPNGNACDDLESNPTGREWELRTYLHVAI